MARVRWNERLAVAGGIGGLITFILGAFVAIFQQDLKGLLAYSTISHLGLITLLTGLDTPGPGRLQSSTL